MNPLIVLYATREGHTRKVAEHVAETSRRHGVQAVVREVDGPAPAMKLDDYSAAILAASVHAGEHEPEMVDFVRQHKGELETMPSAFLSLSLTEANVEMHDLSPEERAHAAEAVKQMLDKFFDKTGWHPSRVKAVAGALMYTKYNLMIRFVMKRIAQKAGGSTDTSRDHEYTDWAALDRFVDEFIESVPGADALRVVSA